MLEVRRTELFSQWMCELRDSKARARIQTRIDRLQLGLRGDVQPVGIDRLQLGLCGDVQPVGEGISEMRIDYGPGYRVYFIQRGKQLVILLAGGDKRTQDRDIKTAQALVRDL